MPKNTTVGFKRLPIILAMVLVLAAAGCNTTPSGNDFTVTSKIAKTQNYDIRIIHGLEDAAAADDLKHVIEDLTAQVPWAADTLAKYKMSFAFSMGDSFGESLACYNQNEPDVIKVNPHFRKLLVGFECDFYASLSGDKNYPIKKTILHELIHKEQDARGLMKLIENLKPSDYCVAANFMEIDPNLKANFILLGQTSQEWCDLSLKFECENWKEHESYTTRNLLRSLFNKPSGRITSVDECVRIAAQCGPSNIVYSESALMDALGAIYKLTWGDSSDFRAARLQVEHHDKKFLSKQLAVGVRGNGFGR